MDPRATYPPRARCVTGPPVTAPKIVGMKRPSPPPSPLASGLFMVHSATRPTLSRSATAPAGPRPLPQPPRLEPAPRGIRANLITPPAPTGLALAPPNSSKTTLDLPAIASPLSPANRPHPAQVGARRLSINTIKKMSSRSLFSPQLSACSSSRPSPISGSSSPTSAQVKIQISSPESSSCSGEAPDLIADEGSSSAEWEDEDSVSMYTQSDNGSAIIQTATRQAVTVQKMEAVSATKQRVPAPRLPKLMVPQGRFIVCNPTSPLSPLSPADSPQCERSHRSRAGRQSGTTHGKRKSQASHRALRGGARTSTVSVGTTASGMPTFAAPSGADFLQLPVGTDDEVLPPSPTLLHPLRNKKLPVAAGAMQHIYHSQEFSGPWPDERRVSVYMAKGTARRKLGLPAATVEVYCKNVVEAFEESNDSETSHQWQHLPYAARAPRIVQHHAPKKATFSGVRKLFARRA
ncbi:hypothetical protein BKA62DRAFT_698517 [Auriculariales sp. MPI-PUGE-AT-0066]|nr:hypothetical protein BKA62DRAFT_698517 [Auriculariales sp. MPI-PUGE-AT-0066]